MAKAIVTKVHNATDISKGVSIRLLPDPEPQTHPAWVIESAVEAGAATGAAGTGRVGSAGRAGVASPESLRLGGTLARRGGSLRAYLDAALATVASARSGIDLTQAGADPLAAAGGAWFRRAAPGWRHEFAGRPARGPGRGPRPTAVRSHAPGRFFFVPRPRDRCRAAFTEENRRWRGPTCCWRDCSRSASPWA